MVFELPEDAKAQLTAEIATLKRLLYKHNNQQRKQEVVNKTREILKWARRLTQLAETLPAAQDEAVVRGQLITLAAQLELRIQKATLSAIAVLRQGRFLPFCTTLVALFGRIRAITVFYQKRLEQEHKKSTQPTSQPPTEPLSS